MSGKETLRQTIDQLDDDDRMHIAEVFHEDIAPRLLRMGARTGNINCDFAGQKYMNWVIEFKSTRSGFDIVDFEYDEESRNFELAPLPDITQIVKKHV